MRISRCVIYRRLAALGVVSAGLAGIFAAPGVAQTALKGSPGIFHTFTPPPGPYETAPSVPVLGKSLQAGNQAFRDGKFAAARVLWEKAAQEGDLFAQWQLANLYRSGRGVAVDHRKAFQYYAAVAARHKNTGQLTRRTRITVDSIVRLADYFRTGVKQAKIPKRIGQAFRLYQFAATYFSHPSAQFALGQIYVRGEGVKKSIGRGMRWYLLAARKRHAPAQAALGDLYLRGEGVRKDEARALMWYTLARQSARAKSAKRIAESYRQLYDSTDGSLRTKAENLVAVWNEKFPGPTRKP